jgi:hypothetical protein
VSDQAELIAKLERLQQLRDAGVLTQVELEAQKAALLGHPTMTCPGCGAPLQVVTADQRCIYCGMAAPQGAQVTVLSDDSLADAIWAANRNTKIKAIKELRERTGLGLKEAKERIDAAERRSR